VVRRVLAEARRETGRGSSAFQFERSAYGRDDGSSEIRGRL